MKSIVSLVSTVALLHANLGPCYAGSSDDESDIIPLQNGKRLRVKLETPEGEGAVKKAKTGKEEGSENDHAEPIIHLDNGKRLRIRVPQAGDEAPQSLDDPLGNAPKKAKTGKEEVDEENISVQPHQHYTEEDFKKAASQFQINTLGRDKLTFVFGEILIDYKIKEGKNTYSYPPKELSELMEAENKDIYKLFLSLIENWKTVNKSHQADYLMKILFKKEADKLPGVHENISKKLSLFHHLIFKKYNEEDLKVIKKAFEDHFHDIEDFIATKGKSYGTAKKHKMADRAAENLWKIFSERGTFNPDKLSELRKIKHHYVYTEAQQNAPRPAAAPHLFPGVAQGGMAAALRAIAGQAPLIAPLGVQVALPPETKESLMKRVEQILQQPAADSRFYLGFKLILGDTFFPPAPMCGLGGGHYYRFLIQNVNGAILRYNAEYDKRRGAGGSDAIEKWNFDPANLRSATEEELSKYDEIIEDIDRAVKLRSSEKKVARRTIRRLKTLHKNNEDICAELVEAVTPSFVSELYWADEKGDILFHPEQSDVSLEQRAHTFYNILMLAWDTVQKNPSLKLDFYRNAFMDGNFCLEGHSNKIQEWLLSQKHKAFDQESEAHIGSLSIAVNISKYAEHLVSMARDEQWEKGNQLAQAHNISEKHTQKLAKIRKGDKKYKNEDEKLEKIAEVEFSKKMSVAKVKALEEELETWMVDSGKYEEFRTIMYRAFLGKKAKDGEINEKHIDDVLIDMLGWSIERKDKPNA